MVRTKKGGCDDCGSNKANNNAQKPPNNSQTSVNGAVKLPNNVKPNSTNNANANTPIPANGANTGANPNKNTTLGNNTKPNSNLANNAKKPNNANGSKNAVGATVGGRVKRGGSLASDSVMNLVVCETYEQMAQMASNTVPSTTHVGGGRRKRGGDCASGSSVSGDYSIGPATVPTGLPAAGAGTNMAGVQASVLATLAQEVPSLGGSYQNVVYPDVFVDQNIHVKMMSGGSVGCMCGTA